MSLFCSFPNSYWRFCVTEGLYWWASVNFSFQFKFLTKDFKTDLNQSTSSTDKNQSWKTLKQTKTTLFIFCLFFFFSFYFQLLTISMFHCLSGVSGRSHNLKLPLFSSYCNFVLQKSSKETSALLSAGRDRQCFDPGRIAGARWGKRIVRDVQRGSAPADFCVSAGVIVQNLRLNSD